jgi:hypothetical protein
MHLIICTAIAFLLIFSLMQILTKCDVHGRTGELCTVYNFCTCTRTYHKLYNHARFLGEGIPKNRGAWKPAYRPGQSRARASGLCQ